MTDWSQSFQLGANYKHSDCNGDGVVNAQDTLAISLNYGNVHPFRFAQPPAVQANYPDFYLVANMDTAGTNQQVNFDLMLGRNTLPVDSIYAIAFKLNYNPANVQANMMGCTFGTSWMGTIGSNMISMQKNFDTQGYMDVALTRINQTNATNGMGQIGTFRLTTPSSGSNIVSIPVSISDAYAVTVGKRTVSLNLWTDSVIFNPNLSGINNLLFSDLFSLYPNPSNGIFTLESKDNSAGTVEICNTLGEVVMSISVTGTPTKIDACALASGIYTIRVTTDKGTFYTKLQLTN